MKQTIWTLPVPSTALLQGSTFHKLPRRGCVLSCEYEGDDDQVVSLKLLFEDVQAFKCTYEKACTAEMISTAYDKVVDLGSSEWLTAVREQLASFGVENVEGVKHLIIYLDGGPCYEFLCRNFRVEESSA